MTLRAMFGLKKSIKTQLQQWTNCQTWIFHCCWSRAVISPGGEMNSIAGVSNFMWGWCTKLPLKQWTYVAITLSSNLRALSVFPGLAPSFHLHLWVMPDRMIFMSVYCRWWWCGSSFIAAMRLTFDVAVPNDPHWGWMGKKHFNSAECVHIVAYRGKRTLIRLLDELHTVIWKYIIPSA